MTQSQKLTEDVCLHILVAHEESADLSQYANVLVCPTWSICFQVCLQDVPTSAIVMCG